MGAVFSRCVHAPVGDATARGATIEATERDTKRGDAARTTQQPLLTPDDWFLSPDELSASRGGIARASLATFSGANNVTAFSSSDSFYASVHEDLEATTGKDDFVWIVGWTLNHEVPLLPVSANYEQSTIKRVIERAVLMRGVQVRALVWTNLFHRDESIAARDWMNALTVPARAQGGSGSAMFLFDNRLPHKTSSHHQKFVVIRRAGVLVAYVGGLDLSVDRWDTSAHDQKLLREQRGIAAGSDGWIDAAVRLEGAAALDVAATFASRWNSNVKPATCWTEELLDFENPDVYDHVTVPAVVNDSRATRVGSCAVQIVRTFSPHKAASLYPELAPHGELSLLHARIKAIRHAKNYVYVEDQYFFLMPQLLDALQDALPRLQRVIVVVQRPTVTLQSKVSGYEKLVFEMAKPLLDAFPTKLHIYTTKEPRNVYIHTKLLLVDDVFASVGSANWNRRSMTSDSEIAANLVDATHVDSIGDSSIKVGALVRDLRLRKLAEMTGATAAVLARLSITEGFDRLARAAQDPTTLLDELEVARKWEFVVFQDAITQHVVDPDDLNDDASDDEM